MNSFSSARRWIITLFPALLVGAYAYRAVALENEAADITRYVAPVPTNFLLHIDSLVPYVDKSEATVMTTASLGQAIDLERTLKLPISVRLELDGSHTTAAERFYSIEILDRRGRVISSMVIGDRTSASFPNNQIDVYVQAVE